MYHYRARLVRVIDGNTIEADIDLGFGVFTRQRIRLYGVDAAHRQQGGNNPELQAETQRTSGLVPREFTVETIMNKRGKIGRVMGILHTINETPVNINEQIIEAGAKRIDN